MIAQLRDRRFVARSTTISPKVFSSRVTELRLLSPTSCGTAIGRSFRIDSRKHQVDGGFQLGKTMLVDANLVEAYALVPAGQLAGSVVLAGQRDATPAK